MTDKIEWITVRGNHIPVKEGETKKEAVEKFINEKKGKKLTLEEAKEIIYENQIKITKGKNFVNETKTQIENLEKKQKKAIEHNSWNKEQIEQNEQKIKKYKQEILQREKEIKELEEKQKKNEHLKKQAEELIKQEKEETIKKESEAEKKRQERQKKQREKYEKLEQARQNKIKEKIEIIKKENAIIGGVLEKANEDFKTSENMNEGGYKDKSMSNRAIKAYAKGFVPKSKLSTEQKRIAELIGASEWHHTSKGYNKTNFYDTHLFALISHGASDKELEQYLDLTYEYEVTKYYDSQSLEEWKKARDKYKQVANSIIINYLPQKIRLELGNKY